MHNKKKRILNKFKDFQKKFKKGKIFTSKSISLFCVIDKKKE